MNRSRKQETDVAAQSGGRRTPASGAFWHHKGDVRTKQFLMELKYTEKSSITLSKRVWDKIRREAILDGRLPAMVLDIQGRRLVVLDMEDFIANWPAAEGDLGEGGLS